VALRRALLVIFLTCHRRGQGAWPGAGLPEPLGTSQVTKVPVRARLGRQAGLGWNARELGHRSA